MKTIKIINSFKKNIFYLNRSLAGPDNLKTIRFIKKFLPNLKIKSFESSKKIFDWKSPKVWTVKKAYIEDENKNKIIDIKNNFLHVLNYSSKINKFITKKELFKNLYFIKSMPKAIPYVTSYYFKKWGFCVKYDDLKKFQTKKYKVFIDSKFSKKKIPYAEYFIKGKSKKEFIFSTYICHPNLANDNFSGIIINALIADYLKKRKKLNYSYRIIFIPETIGSINYINKRFNYLKKNTLAGYVLSCLGHGKKINVITKYDHYFSFKIVKRLFEKAKYSFQVKKWKERGSDERQFSSPNVNLPFTLVTKDKFMEYKNYHTSLDNLDYIKNNDLIHSFNFFKKLILFIEKQEIFISKFKCEPFLSKYNLYSKISSSYSKNLNQENFINIIDYCDGYNTLEEISVKLNINKNKLNILVKELVKKKIIKKI